MPVLSALVRRESFFPFFQFLAPGRQQKAFSRFLLLLSLPDQNISLPEEVLSVINKRLIIKIITAYAFLSKAFLEVVRRTD